MSETIDILASQPLIAPENGYKIEPHFPIFGYQRKKLRTDIKNIEIATVEIITGRSDGKTYLRLSYYGSPSSKEHGNIKDAFLNRLVGDYEDKSQLLL